MAQRTVAQQDVASAPAANVRRTEEFHLPKDGPNGDTIRFSDSEDQEAPAEVDAAQARATNASRRDIPGYEILGELGRGGMGVVYKARQKQLNRLVALKMILHSDHANRDQRLRFEREARAIARLEHPNIVHIHEIGEHDGKPFFSLEYVTGGGLDKKLCGEPMSPREAAKLVETLADAMHVAHQAGVIHRDLKPANVLMTEEGEPKITDFGLAKNLGEAGQTETGAVMGTPSYMAPEQAMANHGEIGAGSDAYALGVILYECLSGHPPFQAATAMDTILQVIDQPPPSLSRQRPEIPKDLETICLKCLEKNSRQRDESARLLADELRRFQNGEPILARPVGRLERGWRLCKRYPVVAGLALLVLVSLVAGTAFSTAFAIRAGTRELEAIEAKNATQREKGKAVALAEQKTQTVEALQDNLYVADLRAAQSALEEGDSDRALELLQKHQPAASLPDRRGFAWYYLLHQCRNSRGVVCETEPQLYRMALSPDGKTLAVGQGEGNKLYLCDAKSGEHLWTDELPQKNFDIEFSPDGKVLAVTCGKGKRQTQREYEYAGVYLYDLSAGPTSRKRLSEESTLGVCLAFSPQGDMLACGAEGGRIEVWDYVQGKRVAQLQVQSDSRDVEAIAFTPDGGRLISATYGGAVRVWEVGKAIVPRVLIQHQYTVPLQDAYFASSWWRYRPVALAVSPDGKLLAAASNGTAIQLWNLANDQSLGQLEGHADAVTSLKFDQEGKRLVSGSLDRSIRVWDVEKRTEIERIGSHRDIVSSVAITPQQDEVLSAGDEGTVRRWRLPQPGEDEPEVLKGNALRSLIYALGLSPDKRMVASGGFKYAIPLHDLHRGELIRYLKRDHGRVYSLAFSPDGKHLACANYDDHLLEIWDCESEQNTMRIEHVGPVGHVTYSEDGKKLAVSDQRGVHIRDAGSGKRLWSLQGMNAEFSADGRWLAVCGKSGVVVHSAVNYKPEFQFPCEHAFSPAVFSRDSRLLAVVDNRKTILIWDVDSQELLHRISGHFAAIAAIAFCQDGKTLASVGEDGRTILWDLVTGKQKAVLRGHVASVTALAFSRDGQVLATGGLDEQIRLWRAPRCRGPVTERASTWSNGRALFIARSRRPIRRTRRGNASRSL